MYRKNLAAFYLEYNKLGVFISSNGVYYIHIHNTSFLNTSDTQFLNYYYSYFVYSICDIKLFSYILCIVNSILIACQTITNSNIYINFCNCYTMLSSKAYVLIKILNVNIKNNIYIDVFINLLIPVN